MLDSLFALPFISRETLRSVVHHGACANEIRSFWQVWPRVGDDTEIEIPNRSPPGPKPKRKEAGLSQRRRGRRKPSATTGGVGEKERGRGGGKERNGTGPCCCVAGLVLSPNVLRAASFLQRRANPRPPPPRPLRRRRMKVVDAIEFGMMVIRSSFESLATFSDPTPSK